MHPFSTFSQSFPNGNSFNSGILIIFLSRKKFLKSCHTYVTNKTVVEQLDCNLFRSDLKYVEVLAILKFAIFFAEKPSQHLSGFHTGAYNASRFVPMSTTLTATAVSILLVTLDHL